MFWLVMAGVIAFFGLIAVFEQHGGAWLDRKLGFRDPAEKHLDDY